VRCLCVVSGGVSKRGRCQTETHTGQTILPPETRKPLADKITIELYNKLGNKPLFFNSLQSSALD
jgi:hypothetical protein